MKKILFSAAIAFAAIATGIAQTVTKPVVRVLSFEYSQAFGTAEVEIIRNNVIQSLNETKRIIIVDSEKENSAVDIEGGIRKNVNTMNDDHAVGDIGLLNANYLLKGMLNSINTTESKSTDKDGNVKYSYKTKLEYSLQLIDPSTGATVYSNTYSSSASSGTSAESRKKAVSGSSASMKSFIEAAFPVKGTILAAKDIDTKKNAAKTVYINLGNDQGIMSGQKFSVYAVVDIAGEKSETEIGTVTAAEVMSGTRTLCKVNKGGDVILQKLNAKEEMTIKTREIRTFLDKI